MKKLYALGVVLLLIFSIQIAHASTYPNGCTATTAYSSTTGQPCNTPQTCVPGDLFNSQTGQPCSGYLPGCSAGTIYSVSTGQKCDGSSTSNNTNIVYFPGCTSFTGYSMTTGKACDGSVGLVKIIPQLDTQTPVAVIPTQSIPAPVITASSEETDTASVSATQSQRLGVLSFTNTSNTEVSLLGATLTISDGVPGDNFPLYFSLSGLGGQMGTVDVVIDNSGSSQTIAFSQPLNLPANSSQDFIVMTESALKPQMANQTITTKVALAGVYGSSNASVYATGTITTAVTQ